MNRNFFIRLTFAAHRVADVLPQGEQIANEIRESANEILTDLLLLVDKEETRPEKKQELLFQVERQIDILLVYLDRAKRQNWIHPGNFSLLEAEYGKIRELLEIFHDIQRPGVKIGQVSVSTADTTPKKEMVVGLVPSTPGESDFPSLTPRQKKIIEFLRAKENVQVWELQKVLPEVTKRTLRRDLDELLQKNIVERKGAWNAVAYQLK